MLALDALTATQQAIVFAIAFVLLLSAGIIAWTEGGAKAALLELGLAAFVSVWFWNAIAAT